MYSLFGGKPALLKALFDEAFHRFGAHLAAVAPSGNPVEDLYRLGLAYRASALADPHFYEVMFGSAPGGLLPRRRVDRAGRVHLRSGARRGPPRDRRR